MPKWKKTPLRKVEIDNDSSRGQSSGQSTSGTYDGQRDILATFKVQSPHSCDFPGIMLLLWQLFLKAQVDVYYMTSAFTTNENTGIVLKQSFDASGGKYKENSSEVDIVYGISGVFNFDIWEGNKYILPLFIFLRENAIKHTDYATQLVIQRIIWQTRLGFLINERFINIPAKVSVNMLNSLYNELETRKKKDTFSNFEYYMMICKTWRPKENREEIFCNDEEKIFSKEAEINFEFSVAPESGSGHRRILFFKAEKLGNIISQVTAFFQ